MSIFDRLFKAAMPARAQLSYRETENNFLVGVRSLSQSQRDRYDYDRREILEQCLEAWRLNPLARRIVGLVSQYVVGGGVSVTCENTRVNDFLREEWEHPLNRMDTRCIEWCDELTRTGNLFIIISTDAAGFSYFRLIPTQYVEKITSAANDLEQVQEIVTLMTYNEPAVTYPSYLTLERGDFRPCVLHYTINRPAGAQWGEPDLAPLLKWLSRYAGWLEDRARLNHYRNSFLYTVKTKFISEAERQARQRVLNSTQPAPGSILVTDENEEWGVINPTLESQDAAEDGLALKKMIAAGAGVPLHFLAEPESSTRTTAEAAGGPTYRHFEQRQKIFLYIIKDIMRVAVDRRDFVDTRLNSKVDLDVSGADISARDNASLAVASSTVVNGLAMLRDAGFLADAELMRVYYRFLGETVDLEELMREGKAEKEKRKPEDRLTADPTSPDLTPSRDLTPSPFPQGKGGRGKGGAEIKGSDIVNKETGEEKRRTTDLR
jgi:hypothetical protein